ncbi:hypothetical protein CAQUA_10850 [Corynebacterium aquatimens]|nr:hypothetical protein CAQUA_10850 [Corynebacterium aquatimens]
MILCGCTGTSLEPSGSSTALESPAAQPVDAVPIAEVAHPGAKTDADTCPYLSNDFVEKTNGQKVTGVHVDQRFITPGCVFWSFGDEWQVRVTVRHVGSADEARRFVDKQAPVDSTDPAELPGGWQGGRGGKLPTVFAVSKGTVAVAVSTDQAQSVKAELIAQAVIKNLKL